MDKKSRAFGGEVLDRTVVGIWHTVDPGAAAAMACHHTAALPSQHGPSHGCEALPKLNSAHGSPGLGFLLGSCHRRTSPL